MCEEMSEVSFATISYCFSIEKNLGQYFPIFSHLDYWALGHSSWPQHLESLGSSYD